MSRNLVQLVITLVTLIKGSVDLVQTSLVGTALSNLLLMTGSGIFLGGIDRFEQHFNSDAVGSLLNELAFTIAVLFMFDAFYAWPYGPLAMLPADVATLSRVTSILLILSYVCCVIYSYKSNATMFTEPHPKAKRWRDENSGSERKSWIARIGLRVITSLSGTRTSAHTEKNKPLASFSWIALVLMVAIDAALLGFSTTFVCDSIDNLTQSSFDLSRTFIGLILLPIVSCNPHAITLARRDQMLQSFAISISGSVQLLLLVLPSTVLVGWMLGNPDMALSFDGFQLTCLLISIMSLKYVTAGGKSNWYAWSIPWSLVTRTEHKLG